MSARLFRLCKAGAANTLLALAMLFFVGPALWIVVTSVRHQIEVNSFPPVWFPKSLTLDGFRKLLTAREDFGGSSVPFVTYLTNSVIVSVGATVAAVFLGSIAAFGFSQWRGRLSSTLFVALILSRAVPAVALSVPLAVLFIDLRLIDTRVGLIAAYTAISTPLCVFLMDAFFRSIPVETFEAARVDGAGLIETFTRIALPMVKPGLAASALLAFVTTWNEFQIASVLSLTRQSTTLPRGLFDFTNLHTIDWQAMSAMAALMFIPPLVFVVIAQRHFVRGLTLASK